MSRIPIQLVSLFTMSVLALAGAEATARGFQMAKPGGDSVRQMKQAERSKPGVRNLGAAGARRSSERLVGGQSAASPFDPAGPGSFSAGFLVNCAAGFQLTGKDQQSGDGGTWIASYSCATPVIQCPSQILPNGLTASVSPKARIVQLGGDPDGGKRTFRVEYECDYGYNFIPEG